MLEWSCLFCNSFINYRLTGKPPFSGIHSNELLINNKKGIIEYDKEQWKSISNEAIDLITKMLENDPTIRIDASEALEHKWFSMKYKSTQTIYSATQNMEKYQDISRFNVSKIKPEFSIREAFCSKKTPKANPRKSPKRRLLDLKNNFLLKLKNDKTRNFFNNIETQPIFRDEDANFCDDDISENCSTNLLHFPMLDKTNKRSISNLSNTQEWNYITSSHVKHNTLPSKKHFQFLYPKPTIQTDLATDEDILQTLPTRTLPHTIKSVVNNEERKLIKYKVDERLDDKDYISINVDKTILAYNKK